MGALKVSGHVQSGQLLRAGPERAILRTDLLNAAAPRAFDRQMESTSRDLFATYQACGHRRTAPLATTCHQLAGHAAQPGACELSRTSASAAISPLGSRRPGRRCAATYIGRPAGDPATTIIGGPSAVLANGEVDEAVKLAERVLQVDKTDRIARLVLGVRALKQKQYPVARRELAQSIRGPITDLAATLLSAWTMASPGEAKSAVDTIDKLAGADWYAIFKDLHAALILDLAGQKKEAAKRLERAYKLDPTALRVVQSYGFLSRGVITEALGSLPPSKRRYRAIR
jgi:tetratricopeptide (TPR) repeat protein